jgi:hypothetical protein
MRKPVSKRRWKARYRLGKYIPAEAVLNHRLELFVRDGEWHLLARMIRRVPA